MARVLIVDDIPVNRELIHGHLADSGYELIDADSGEAALALARLHGPDLVLLDVMMPGLDGFETARRLKAQSGMGFLPVVLLTSLNDRSSRLFGLEAGADDFLSKPVDGQELRVRVKNLLALRAKDLALTEQNVALAELNRFRNEMSELIVHDLRSPLAVILASHDFLAEGLRGADADYLEALDDSRTSCQRILRLLANLLDTAQLEASRFQLGRRPTAVLAMLEQIAHERRQLARGRHITLDVVATEVVELQADADLLSRALENIVDNALRYTPSEGHVELRTWTADGRTHIRVANTGAPVPVEARSVIFEKFAQVTSTFGRRNLGLGLYFCRLVVEAHNGKIWVEEAPDFRTAFVLQFPA